jgi:hypothetical protein
MLKSLNAVHFTRSNLWHQGQQGTCKGLDPFCWSPTDCHIAQRREENAPWSFLFGPIAATQVAAAGKLPLLPDICLPVSIILFLLTFSPLSPSATAYIWLIVKGS